MTKVPAAEGQIYTDVPGIPDGPWQWWMMEDIDKLEVIADWSAGMNAIVVWDSEDKSASRNF